MKIEQFVIGQEFFASAGFRWLCTDKGTRTITAIMLNPDLDAAWFVGPPYSVEEVVFDAIDMEQCYLDFKEELGERLQDLETSAHPNFDATDVFKMMDVKKKFVHYPRAKALKRDRVGPHGEILHPYAAYKKVDTAQTDIEAAPVWFINVFELFSKEYSDMPEDDFIKLALSTEQDLRARKISFDKS